MRVCGSVLPLSRMTTFVLLLTFVVYDLVMIRMMRAMRTGIDLIFGLSIQSHMQSCYNQHFNTHEAVNEKYYIATQDIC